jgi:signal transduction histidine kinase/CheY-like chemotaxis protein
MIFGLLVTVVLTLFVRYIRNQQFNLKEAVAMQTAELNNHLVELTEAKRQVEQSDKLKTAFLNNISHEVRTPLNGILGFTSMLVHDEIPVNEREEFISMIRESANRLTHTITNYMDISLLVTKNYKVTKKPVNLFQVLCGTIAMFKHACSLKKLLLVSEVDISDRELVLNTDKDLLEKILMHLVDNAVKFTSSGKIVVGFKTSETLVTFFIRDTGSGISKAAQQRIFEVFMQEDISHTRGYEGSGLGLSISHESVQLLGGTIAVKSEKGEGSEFSFTLPLVHPDARKEQPATGTGSPEAISITILIAEDESANGLFLQKSLTKAGYHSILVTDGKQAVEAVKKNPEISLVLMDIKMPVMDGYEASRLIKSIRSDLVIIAISAYDLAGDEVRALEAGCDDYIIKPVNRDLLFRIISRFIK